MFKQFIQTCYQLTAFIYQVFSRLFLAQSTKLIATLLFLTFHFSFFTFGQTASFATWKDNKKAAYTIVHDDFGDYVTGIYDYAYPIATARGIKFSFGAITANYSTTEWTKAKTMIAAGHDCINHSHDHKCGGTLAQCGTTPSYGAADFPTELDLSTQLIQTNTGIRPIFFIHPYDTYTTAIINYLKNNLGYIGSRAGTGSLNTANFTNYMNLNFYGFDNSASAIAGLKTSVDDVIASGGYLMREFHGINDPSYAAMTIATYTNHCDYVKTKIADGSIWSATVSEVLTYKLQRDAFNISTTYSASAGTINVNFTPLSSTQNGGTVGGLNTAILRTPVTINVNVGTIAGTFAAFQGSTAIKSTRVGNIISFNVYPHQGNISLKTGTIPNPDNVTNFSASPQSGAVNLTWLNPTTPFDQVLVVAKANTPFTSQPTATNYAANSNFTGLASTFEGGKVVYFGTGASVNVTGLTNGTLYHFKVFTKLGTKWSSGVATSATPVAVQQPSLASFATWKDNKKAAYTIVHDDFGDYVTGIYDYAYPIATARGIKFSFGAITANCSTTEWTKAKTMIAAGHEIINHSYDHKCGGSAADCGTTPSYGVADFPTELDLSTQQIQTNTGVRPIFFIHPYDVYTPQVLSYLKNNLGYIGTRAGTGIINSPNFTNFMNLNFYGFDNSAQAISNLKVQVDQAIIEGGYLMHEFHGVNDPSYASMTITTYTNHCDYVKSKITDGSIWSATASEVLTYKMQRDAFTIGTVYTPSAGTIHVNFIPLSSSQNGGTVGGINTSILKTPATVNVNVSNIAGTFTATQGSTAINLTRVGNIISFNVYPHQGNVVLKSNVINLSSTNRVVEFDGSLMNNQVVLKWAVNGNDLIDYYLVEKFDNNQTIKQLATNSARNNDAVSIFSYTDANPIEGENLYRLTTVGLDGVNQTSVWLNIKFTRQELYTISPNPSNDELDIDISSEQGKSVELTLISPLGQIMKAEKIESVGTSHQIWDLENIPTGNYYLKIQAKGKREVIKKVIVIK